MRNLFLIAVGVVLLIGVTIWYVLSSNTQVNYPFSQSNNGIESEVDPVDLQSITDNLMGLLEMNQDLQCNFRYPGFGSSVVGTVYIADGNLRNDFIITTEDTHQNISMVKKDLEIYAWSDAMSEGVKIPFDSGAGFTRYTEQEYFNFDNNFDPDQVISYRCSQWQPNVELFIPPTDVEFIDINQ